MNEAYMLCGEMFETFEIQIKPQAIINMKGELYL